MSDLRSQFQEVLDRMLAGSDGDTVGGAAGWCLLDSSAPGPADPPEQGIVYGGKVASRAEGPVAPPDDDTLWEIGSVSKTFAAALLALRAAGDPTLLTRAVLPDVARWLGPSQELPEQLTEITYNRLVSMWAGLVKDNRSLGSSSPDAYPVADLFQNLQKAGSYTGEPCTWLYSNVSLAVLGWALTSVYGVAPGSADELPSVYLDLLRKELLDPLDLPATWAVDADPEHLPVGWAQGQPTTTPDADWPADDPAGALTLSAPALLTWVRANLAPGDVLGGEALQLLRTPIVPTGKYVQTGGGDEVPEGGSSCRGWFLIPSSQSPGAWLYNKNGRVRGFVSGVAYAPPETLSGTSTTGVFVVANDSDLMPEAVAEELLAVALADRATRKGAS